MWSWLIFSKIFSILWNTLLWHSKKIPHVLFCEFQTKSNKVVNIFCGLPEFITNVQRSFRRSNPPPSHPFNKGRGVPTMIFHWNLSSTVTCHLPRKKKKCLISAIGDLQILFFFYYLLERFKTLENAKITL